VKEGAAGDASRLGNRIERGRLESLFQEQAHPYEKRLGIL